MSKFTGTRLTLTDINGKEHDVTDDATIKNFTPGPREPDPIAWSPMWGRLESIQMQGVIPDERMEVFDSLFDPKPHKLVIKPHGDIWFMPSIEGEATMTSSEVGDYGDRVAYDAKFVMGPSRTVMPAGVKAAVLRWLHTHSVIFRWVYGWWAGRQ